MVMNGQRNFWMTVYQGNNAERLMAMLNITLNRFDGSFDRIASLLPVVESAMETGEVCQIHNINYLSLSELVALRFLAMADKLLDTGTGKICHSVPGFYLVGIDEYGRARVLS